MKVHKKDCRQVLGPQCRNCGSATVGILQTPMSFLHHLDESFVSVFVHPICEKKKYETQTRQRIQSIMAEVAQESYIDSSWGPGEILCRKICGMKRCRRCKVVVYYGREHQKID
jgi:hypothetical protein